MRTAIKFDVSHMKGSDLYQNVLASSARPLSIKILIGMDFSESSYEAVLWSCTGTQFRDSVLAKIREVACIKQVFGSVLDWSLQIRELENFRERESFQD